jgi:hypothetical protein
MGLEPFKCVEIRSNIMGIPVFIYEEAIAFMLRRDASGKFAGSDIPNPKTSPWKEVVNMSMFGTEKKGKYSEPSIEKKMLLKSRMKTFCQKEEAVISHHLLTESSFTISSRRNSIEG